jgi:hypothetical protein
VVATSRIWRLCAATLALYGCAGWDQRLFETMRTWRYTPYVGESGQPEPVCHGVTFIYRPRGGR